MIDIQLISFILAMVVAGVCFALVKITADEFDRWYDEPELQAPARIPPAARILGILLALLVIVR